MILYNSKNEQYKKPFGAILYGQETVFHITVIDQPSGGSGEATFLNKHKATEAYLVMAKDGEEPIYIHYDETFTSSSNLLHGVEQPTQVFRFIWKGPFAGLFFYRFKVVYDDGRSELTEEYQITVYEKDSYDVPRWMQRGLMYQIFPDRFARDKDFNATAARAQYEADRHGSAFMLHDVWGEEPVHGPDEHGIVWNNDFFGGNLKGVIEHLGYFAGLGVTVLYFNPIFKAFSSHRYDTGDYKTIDPLLGTEEDFRILCAQAAKRGIRIILDGVFNHTGCDSLYFNKYGSYDTAYSEEIKGLGAYQSKESIYYDWYRFTDYPEKYDSWWGIDTLPAVNEMAPSYLDYMLRGEDSVIKHWLRAGASGVRLDVADELPDDFLDELRIAVKSVNPNAAIIGEVWEDASNKMAYGVRRKYLQGKQLDSVMNYPLKDGIIDFVGHSADAKQFEALIERIWENYPKDVFYALMNILSTHDIVRILTVFINGSDDQDLALKPAIGQQKLFLSLLILAFMPGIPCIYYGDEIGMEGERDPLNRRCFDLHQTKREVAEFYKKLLIFRKKIPALSGREEPVGKQLDEYAVDGMPPMAFKPIAADGSFYAFARVADSGRVVIAVNAGATCADEEPAYMNLSLENGEKIMDFIVTGDARFSGSDVICIPPSSGIAVYVSP